jgi:hypothetical protein
LFGSQVDIGHSVPPVPPNGSRLSCGANAGRRKLPALRYELVGAQTYASSKGRPRQLQALVRRLLPVAGRNSIVVARDFGLPRSLANFTAPGVAYFSRYARSTASLRRPLRTLTARTGMVRSPDWMKPRGSVRKARYQPRVLTLQDRTKMRLSTTTTQMPMNLCVAPALILRPLPSRRATTISAEKRRGSDIRTFCELGQPPNGSRFSCGAQGCCSRT